LLTGLGGFYCRPCMGNPMYACQSTSSGGRKHYAACKTRLRLGGSPLLVEPIPARPAGMRSVTYQRLLARLAKAESELSPRLRTREPDYRNLVVSVGL
jgi:hypothetical protein